MTLDDQDNFAISSIDVEKPRAPEIFADLASSFTYASYQNAIPVLRNIGIDNLSNRHVQTLRLELSSTPAFLRPKTWTIDRIVPGDRLNLSDRKVELDAAYLAGLNEAERGEITFRLFAGAEILDERRHTVRLLARDEWGGVADMAQLLPAFVMPNESAVSSLLRKAAERLTAHGHPSALDGYQSQDPKRAFMLAAAVYSAIASMGLHYAEPPASFESRGQKIRRPGTIAEELLATCLDTTLLFAAALEAAGLHPVILMFDGHAAAGVWLTKRTFSTAIETDLMEVRKALASRELIVFETTGITHRPPMTMEAGQHMLGRRLAEEEAGAFVAAIDVRRARSGGITPLASHEQTRRTISEDDLGPVADLPLPALPSFSYLPSDAAEEKPTNAAGRIDRWQRKLLDLTLRNRLLNFPDSKKTIPFLCADVGYLEDRLAEGAAIRVISLPEQNPLGERDAALYRDVHGRDIQRTFAAEALLRDELASPLEAKQLEARLIDLDRAVRNDFAEGGANTLFLAVGFLRWKKKAEDDRSYRAPLLLVPVRLERRSSSSRFTLRFHEDEPRFNATLLQFLEREFDLQLPQFSGDLPLDGKGIDVPLVLATMRKAIRDVPGMEVIDEAALSTFSFAKFLMWKDLVERTHALRENRLVRHLIDAPEQSYQQAEGSSSFRDERDLDRLYAPSEIVSLLPADSSQTAASIAAAEGLDFVVVGPPGTGKSQTIANMIANCLAKGKTVLFVAEKTAALNVVHRRLRQHGLGNHCIELHSNKSDRKRFLGQLKAAWEHGNSVDASEWMAVNERLKLHRDELNAYVDALHRRYGNGWTPYLALGIALKSGETPAPALSWADRDTHDAATLTMLEELAANAGLVYAAVERRPVLDAVDARDWSSGWQDSLIAGALALRSAIGTLHEASSAYQTCLGLAKKSEVSSAELASLAALATELQHNSHCDVSIAFDRDFARLGGAFAELARSLEAYRQAEAGTAASYPEYAVRDIDADVLERSWREAEALFWPKAVLAKRKLRKLLQGYASLGTADPACDLPHLRRMKDCLANVEKSPLSSKALPIQGLTTDIAAVSDILDRATALRTALTSLGRSPEEMQPMIRALVPCLSGRPDDPVRHAGARLIAAIQKSEAARQSFSNLANRELDPALSLQTIAEQMTDLIEARNLLRNWSVWCGVKRRAVHNGLGPLLEALESGTILPDEARSTFRLAYARWWLPKVLDADPTLRAFRRFQHENAVEQFREIDDMVRSHASRRVVSALEHGLPPSSGVPRNSELGLLRHQMELQRPSQSIRDMIGKMPQAFPKLAPCMLMSPLSIAQYLPPNQALFDVVIFDEASQITTWDAVGAIARGRQTIIVGDPKQLPPTNFFGRNEDEEEVAEHEKDLESILDEAKASGLPVRDLRWHYRSRSESLIAFSNHHYYQNRLVTFPSPAVEDRAVKLRKVPTGVYDQGKSRTNRIEAEAVVAERRLNVAVTRARQELIVFSGFTADQIDADRSKHVAVKHLKTFLDYAERGAIALPAEDRGSVGGFDSPFEEAVASHLERRGWIVVPQIGISQFRIDLGIRRPDNAGAYLAGVECDGATYHSSATARDRDKVREQVLRGLGWNILRVWSTDWWFDAAGCADRLHANLEGLLRLSRERQAQAEAEAQAAPDTGHDVDAADQADAEGLPELPEDALPSHQAELAAKAEFVVLADLSSSDGQGIAQISTVAKQNSPAIDHAYRVADLSTFKTDPDQFYEFAYRDRLKAMIEAVIDAESPLRADALAQRIARAHGWLRTGGRIRERIDLHLRGYDTTNESSGVFIWKQGQVTEVLRYRPPANEVSRRAIFDIPLAELTSVVIDNNELLDQSDPARELAGLLGVERLAATARARLDEAITYARIRMGRQELRS